VTQAFAVKKTVFGSNVVAPKLKTNGKYFFCKNRKIKDFVFCWFFEQLKELLDLSKQLENKLVRWIKEILNFVIYRMSHTFIK
jgi:hypothetical protein